MGRHVADFVEQQRPSVALFEFPDAALFGARKGPPLVTEELALQQGFGDRRTVDRQERGLAPAAVVVNCPGHQFLARAAFAENQHIDILRSDPANLLAHGLHGGPAADQPIRPVLGAVSFFEDRRNVHQPTDGKRLAHDLLELFGIVAGGWQMARAALVARERLVQGTGDAAFLRAKLLTARFYADHVLAQAPGLAEAVVGGAAVLAYEDDQF